MCLNTFRLKDTQKIKWNHNPEHLTAWQTGQTGIPIIDAGMRQLQKNRMDA